MVYIYANEGHRHNVLIVASGWRKKSLRTKAESSWPVPAASRNKDCLVDRKTPTCYDALDRPLLRTTGRTNSDAAYLHVISLFYSFFYFSRSFQTFWIKPSTFSRQNEDA